VGHDRALQQLGQRQIAFRVRGRRSNRLIDCAERPKTVSSATHAGDIYVINLFYRPTSGIKRKQGRPGVPMLFMVIERFRNRDPKPIYRRLRDQGRQMPDGLKYVDSWIEPSFERCFQLMECDDARLLQQWIVHWSDVMEFEIVPVVPSRDTREIVAPHLDSTPAVDRP
jgi:hypothetical protein